jgi:hypothetical protein
MNKYLQKYMSKFYRSMNAKMPDKRGSSGVVQTQRLRDDIINLL